MSMVQDMVNSDLIQDTILNTLITLPLKEVIGISADLQKWFANLTKTRCEYTLKAVTIEPAEDYYEYHGAYIEEMEEMDEGPPSDKEENVNQVYDSVPEYNDTYLISARGRCR